jgi:hypothetical protein
MKMIESAQALASAFVLKTLIVDRNAGAAV